MCVCVSGSAYLHVCVLLCNAPLFFALTTSFFSLLLALPQFDYYSFDSLLKEHLEEGEELPIEMGYDGLALTINLS